MPGKAPLAGIKKIVFTQTMRYFGAKGSLTLALSAFLISLCYTPELKASGGEFGQVGTYTPPVYIPGTCMIDSRDPFDPNARLLIGPSSGKCIDTRERRSVTEVFDHPLRMTFFPDSTFSDTIVANIYHKGRFWVGRVPLSSISSATLQVQYFPLSKLNWNQIAHTQVLLRFDPQNPVELVEQSEPTDRKRETILLNEIVLSIEVVGERGPGFTALKGIQNYFVLAYRLVSLPEKVDWMIHRQHHRVRQWELKLSSNDRSKFLRLFIARSTQVGMQDPYHTLCANCSNVLARLLDVSTGYRPGTCLHTIDSISNFLPWTLRRRNMLGRELPTLNSELGL